jgi:LppX_LprAFG lipoprotein
MSRATRPGRQRCPRLEGIGLGVTCLARGALAVALVAGLLGTGCGGGGGKEAPAPPTHVIVARGVERTAALKSFHFDLKVEHAPSGAPGLTVTAAQGDLLVPDRLRAQINGTFSRTPVQTEIITVGDRSFLRDPLTKQWRPFAGGPAAGALVRGVPAVIARAGGLKNTGSEKVGGVDTYRLSGQVPAAQVAPLLGLKPSGRIVSFTVWIGSDDFRLRRVRVEGPVGKGEPDDIVRTVELSGFDKHVTITPPGVSG